MIFEAYLRNLLDREVVMLGELKKRNDLRCLISLLALRPATLVKIDTLFSTLANSATAPRRSIALLEQAFLVERIPAWS